MDFLKDMKAKLEELEKEAQRQQEQYQRDMAQQKNLFQPKGKKGKQPRRDEFSQGGGRQQQKDDYARGGGRQQAGQQKRSRRPVDSDSCPVEESRGHLDTAGGGQSGGSLLDDLSTNLGEAFLLQEILGPPRCMRAWDE